MDWLDLLEVQGTLKSLLQHHSSKASILQHSAFFTIQLSHPYMTTGKAIALTRCTFVGKLISLLFYMLSRLVITFLPRNKHLLSYKLPLKLWNRNAGLAKIQIKQYFLMNLLNFVYISMEIQLIDKRNNRQWPNSWWWNQSSIQF